MSLLEDQRERREIKMSPSKEIPIPPDREITKIEPNHIIVRGIRIEELIRSWSFAEVVWFLLKGERPSPERARMLEAIFVAMCDHGPTPASTKTARLIVSAGSPIQAAIAGGILAFGDHHAGAIELAMKLFQESVERLIEKEGLSFKEAAQVIFEDHMKNGKKIPGYGHRYHNRDPRPPALIALAKELEVDGPHLKLAIEIEKLLSEHKGIYMNIDGASGSILSDMGFPYLTGRGIFAIGRVPGLLAEVLLELLAYKPFRKDL
ncbi:MAG: citryl-CoA lyase [Synergistetes bacterium]|nr:citryl-CoA lyase [Synergistota bacterium]